MSTPSERIQERLSELGWNKTMLAKEAGVQISTLSRFFKSSDTRLKRAGSMVKIARALGVRPEWILTGTEPKFSIIESTEIMEVLKGETLPRLRAVAETYLGFMQDKVLRMTPETMAKEITSLFINSLIEKTYDKAELRKILNGERMTELPPVAEQTRNILELLLF